MADLRIEEGKFYLTRGGQKYGPFAADWGGDFACPQDIHRYSPEGVRRQPDARLDLVAEWQDEPTGPVRTVTRREIVAGNYGIVEVFHIYGEPLHNIGVRIANHGTAARSCTAQELLSAAMVLSQLAEALEQAK